MNFVAASSRYFDLAKCASPHCFAALLRDKKRERDDGHYYISRNLNVICIITLGGSS